MRRLLLFALVFFVACDNEPTTPTSVVSFSVVSGDGQSGVVGQPLANPLVIKATDSKGRAIRNLVIDFRVTSGGGSTSPATATTNNQGFAQTSWTLGTSTADTQRVEARAMSTGQLFGSFTATAVAGPPAAMVMNSADSQTTTRLTAVPIPPAVRITDQYGNPVPGKSVTFTIPFYDVGGSVTGSPAVSNDDGIATLGSWVVGSVVGRHWVQARIPELAYVVVTFTALGTLENGARMAEYHGSHQVTKINVAFPLGPAVRITDASGNPIEGARPTWTQVQGSGSLAGGSNASRADGVADYTTWTPCCTRGTIAVRVTLSGSPDTVVISSIAEAGPAATVVVQTGNGQTALTNTAVAIAPAVIVRDEFANPVPGVSVDFAVTAGGGSVAGNPATTDTNGIAGLVSWTLGATPGTNSLSATTQGVAGGAGFTATAGSGAVSPDLSTVSAAPTTIAASSGETVSIISVIARNGLGNPVSGATVAIAASGTGNRIVQPFSPTDAQGRATAQLSSTAAEPKVVTATVNGVTLTQTATVTVRGGYPTSFTILEGDNQTAITGTPVPVRPTLLVRDQWGNPSPGVSIPTYPSSGGSICCSLITNDSGLMRVTWTLGPDPGSQMITMGPFDWMGFRFFHATALTPAASLEIVQGDGQTGPANSTLPSSIVVRALNASGEPVANAFVQFNVTKGYGTFTVPAPYQVWDPQKTGADGLATITSWTLGPYGGTHTIEARVVGTDTLVNVNATGTGSAWTRAADLPDYRFLFGTAAAGGKVYAAGGYGFGYPSGENATVEAYDPTTDTWSLRAPMPTPRFGSAAVTISGLVYVVGGLQDVYVLGTLEVYDPVTDTWTPRAPMPTPRAFLGVAVVDGILYAIGGAACVDANVPCATKSVATVEAYDPATDTWTTKASMPTPRQSVGAAVINGRIYAVGGQQTTRPWNETETNSLNTNEEYDPSTDSWTSKAPMPTARYGPSVVAFNGVVYAIGGYASPASLGTNEAFDPVANTWSAHQAMPTPRFWAGGVVVDGRIFVVGGNGAFTNIEAYQP